MKQSQVLFIALRVLLIQNNFAIHPITR